MASRPCRCRRLAIAPADCLGDPHRPPRCHKLSSLACRHRGWPPPAAAPLRRHTLRVQPHRLYTAPAPAQLDAGFTSPGCHTGIAEGWPLCSAARQIQRLASWICPRPGWIRAIVALVCHPVKATMRRPAPAQGAYRLTCPAVAFLAGRRASRAKKAAAALPSSSVSEIVAEEEPQVQEGVTEETVNPVPSPPPPPPPPPPPVDNKCKGKGADKFILDGWRNWNIGEKALLKHVGSSAHNAAQDSYTCFVIPKVAIDYHIEKWSEEDLRLYKIRSTYSLRCLKFLLHQGLAFRGHNESEESNNGGNFIELLKFLASNSEEVNKYVLKNAPGNCTLTSPKIQKQISQCCAIETRKKIMEELGDEPYAILADETSDISNKEQLALCLRYVDKLGRPCERFIGVIHVDDTTSLSLKEAIETLLVRHGLTMAQIRSQGYDGASNMKGDIKGLKTLIMQVSPSASYIHCFAHQLQLVLVAVAKGNTDCVAFFDQISVLLNIIGVSCKRHDMLLNARLENIMKALECGELETGSGLNQEMGLPRREVYIGVIDQIIQELNNRFDDVNMELLSCMAVFNPSDSFASFDAQKIRRLAEFYPNDISGNDLIKLELQLDNYIDDMRQDDNFKGICNLVDLSVKLVEAKMHIVYDMVYLLLKLALLLPVATTSVEGVFSALSLVKTKLRNKMGDSLLDDCLVTFIERNMFFKVDEDDIIETFMAHRKRRPDK
ncbi:uncharacterized protein LOC120709785 [Panicum virgatum]|uniref:uncharacterized protein LOC120709785 n=1 Tax=Panicum virgatum TaxID=38727 RepID=UPI0019D54F19|nr:uncharacterized protein LOC120709785 [Panicum virgatum]